MGHRRAALTPLGRRVLVERVLVLGWTQASTAASAGVSRATVAKWVKRYRDEGLPGLEDRSSAPHRRPHALSTSQVHRILRARRRTGDGPHRLGPTLGHPRSTVYAVLRRHGCSRIQDTDRSTRIPIRYERQRPGELVHIDVKKLGAHSPRWGTPHPRANGQSHLRQGTAAGL